MYFQSIDIAGDYAPGATSAEIAYAMMRCLASLEDDDKWEPFLRNAVEVCIAHKNDDKAMRRSISKLITRQLLTIVEGGKG